MPEKEAKLKAVDSEPMMIIEDLSKIYSYEMKKNAEKIGVPGSYRKLLNMIFINNGCSQLELAKSANLKPSTVSLTLKRMEKDGYIRREVSKKDMRISNVYLTEKGMSFHIANIKKLNYLDDIVTTDFTQEEKDMLMNLLKKMRKNICIAIGISEEDAKKLKRDSKPGKESNSII